MREYRSAGLNPEGLKIIIHMGDRYLGDGPNAKRMRSFYEIFNQCGHHTEILAPTENNISDIPGYVHVCPAVPLKSKSTVNRILNALSYGIASVIEAARMGEADVVVTTCPPALISPFGWVIARFKHAKLVYDVRDIWPDVAWEMGSFPKGSIYSIMFSFIRNFMLKHADLTTAVSDGKVRKLRSYSPRAAVIQIPNGFDVHFLENKEMQEVVELFRLDEIFTCVYVGNIGLAQGLEQLLYVAEKAQESRMRVQFLLFGDGVAEADLKRYVKLHVLNNVYFPGRLPGDKIYTVLRHSGMSFISLVNERLTDSIPTKMYESLGVGCPVLLAAVGDSVNILSETGLGIAVSPNDREALWGGFLHIYRSRNEILANREKAMLLMRTKYSLQWSAQKFERELTARFDYDKGGI